MRPEIQSLKNKIAGQNVFIIAGGPSLTHFDFTRLKGKICIALNSAYKGMEDNLTALLWTDNDWAAAHFDHIINIPCEKLQTRSHASKFIKNNIKGFADSVILDKVADYGFTMDIDSVCGNNSGAQVLNFVTNLQPYRIILLGYDMNTSNGKTHWHGGYDRPAGLYMTAYNDLFIPSINSMAPFIKQMGVDVINCNPDSNLHCFRKDIIDNYL